MAESSPGQAPPRPVSPFERIRRARGLRQSEVAERAGVTRAYVSLCEQGWYPPPARGGIDFEHLGDRGLELWPQEEIPAGLGKLVR
jgi:hypothetical protein